MLNLIRSELARLSWPVLVALLTFFIAFGIVGISQANLEVVLFKFLVFCPALVLVHLSRRTLFPYIDLSQLIVSTALKARSENDEGDLAFAIKDAAAILATFAYYIGMTYVLTAVL